MALKDRMAAVAPRAQQLLNDKDVRTAARRAADATRATYRRASGQNAREAIQDRKLRRQAGAAAAAVGGLLSAVSASSAKRRSRWPRRIAWLGVAAGGVLLIANEDVRSRLAELLGGRNSDDTNPS
jgi:hypothetical protein